MTDDRTLLELAARAAGWPHDARWLNFPEGSAPPQQHYWDPLTDDGDALRLAVKLGINILAAYCGPKAVGRPNGTLADAGGPTPPKEPWGTDPYAATRLAIVRAAASIGQEREE